MSHIEEETAPASPHWSTAIYWLLLPRRLHDLPDSRILARVAPGWSSPFPDTAGHVQPQKTLHPSALQAQHNSYFLTFVLNCKIQDLQRDFKGHAVKTFILDMRMQVLERQNGFPGVPQLPKIQSKK